nr:MAG TPA: holin [Caudoviricetes sp.]
MEKEIISLLLQAFVVAIISAVGVMIRNYLIPWLKKKMELNDVQITQAQLDMATQIISTLVQSAYRKNLAGGLDDPKKYVMDLAKKQLSTVGIELTDEMIDEIRRAALVEWEATVKDIKDNLITEGEQPSLGDKAEG